MNEEAFFKDMKAAFLGRPPSAAPIVTIPIWGWIGDGKTCALLTAQHFMRALEHALCLSIVSDIDEIASLEGSVPEYRGLGLGAIASATNARIREESESFIDRSEWPPGTDEATPFLFGVRSAARLLGYVYFPDLRGGSYQEYDDIAREVFKGAQACMVLTSVSRFLKSDANGNRYHAEILARLQKCAAAGLPTCVLLTQIDRYSVAEADEAHKQLTVMTESIPDLNCEILRVTVVGDKSNGPKKQKHDATQALPPTKERNPTQLIRAFVWTLHAALTRPESQEFAPRRPPVQLGAITTGAAYQPSQRVAEIRSLGEFSKPPGDVLCAADVGSYIFYDDVGALAEVKLPTTKSDAPSVNPVGSLLSPESLDSDLQGVVIGGHLLVGLRREANWIWVGPKGDALTKAALPIQLCSWSALSPRRIVGTDNQGRLHLLQLDGSKWRQQDYLDNFIPASDFISCSVLASGDRVLVVNGTKSEAISVGADRFKDRLQSPFAPKYDTSHCLLNTMGVLAVEMANGTLRAGLAAELQEVGPCHKDCTPAFVLASRAPIVAFVTPDSLLKAAVLSDDKVAATSDSFSPKLASPPITMAINGDGNEVVIVGKDEWSAYRIHGLSHV